jgi:hypothetical protein
MRRRWQWSVQNASAVSRQPLNAAVFERPVFEPGSTRT